MLFASLYCHAGAYPITTLILDGSVPKSAECVVVSAVVMSGNETLVRRFSRNLGEL